MHIKTFSRKLCAAAVSAALVFSLLPAVALAEDADDDESLDGEVLEEEGGAYSVGDTITADGVTYTVTSETTVSVGAQASAGTNYAADSGDVVIASQVEGYEVTAIASYAFSNGSGSAAAITSVYVPASVLSIGASAFYGCGDLATLTFEEGSSLTTISKYAFYDCGITQLEVPASVTSIGTFAFSACAELTTLTFEDPYATSPTLTCGTGAFFARNSEGSGLTELLLPARLKYVPDSMFENQTSLVTLQFAGTSTGYIGSAAFRSCSSLVYIEIPELTSDTKIGSSAFSLVASLKTIVFTGDEDYSPSNSTFPATVSPSSGTTGTAYTYPDVETVVYYGTHTSTIFSSATHYQTVYFHDSEEDALAEENATGYACVRDDILVKDITGSLAATDANGATLYDGAVLSAGSGKSWYFAGESLYEELSDSIHVFAVSNTDLDYGELDLEKSTFSYNAEAIDVAAEVYAVDGTLLTAGTDYALTALDEDGTTLAVDDIVECGTYTVTATGLSKGGYTGSCTATLVVQYEGSTWKRMSGNAKNSTTNHIQEAAYEDLDVDTVILVGEGHEVEGAAAMGLAGYRGAPVLVTESDALSTEAIYTLNHYTPESVIIIGMDDPTSYKESIESTVEFEVSVSSAFDGDTAVATVDKYYSRTKSAGYWDDTDTAIVVADEVNDIVSIGAYAYSSCSPVFLAEGGTTLSDTALSALSGGSFSRVVLVSIDGSLSSEVTTQLAACGITDIVELGGDDAYSATASIAQWLVDECGFSYNGIAAVSASDAASAVAGAAVCGANEAPLVITDDGEEERGAFFSLLQSNIYKVSTGYVLGARIYLPASFLEDVQALWNNGDLYDLNLATVSLSAVSFDYTGEAQTPSVTVTDAQGNVLVEGTDYSLSYYNSKTDRNIPLKQVVENGEYTITATGSGLYSNTRSASFTIVDDSIVEEEEADAGAGVEEETEAGDDVEAVEDGGSTSGSASSTSSGTSNAPKVGSTFKVGKVTYKLTSKSAVAVKKVAASAKGKLTIPAKVRGYSVTSVSAKAFKGCKKLTAVTLASKKLKSIGASAFAGCSKLKTLTVKSTALTGIGSKALYGCKALRTLTLKTKKLAKVGSKALKGVTKRATVKVPSAKVAKYGKLLRKAGLPKAAKVKKG